MAKCIRRKRDGQVTRVSDVDARLRVAQETHEFVSKKEWKKYIKN